MENDVYEVQGVMQRQEPKQGPFLVTRLWDWVQKIQVRAVFLL